jgi:hypothetical protein
MEWWVNGELKSRLTESVLAYYQILFQQRHLPGENDDIHWKLVKITCPQGMLNIPSWYSMTCKLRTRFFCIKRRAQFMKYCKIPRTKANVVFLNAHVPICIRVSSRRQPTIVLQARDHVSAVGTWISLPFLNLCFIATYTLWCVCLICTWWPKVDRWKMFSCLRHTDMIKGFSVWTYIFYMLCNSHRDTSESVAVYSVQILADAPFDKV